MKKLSPFFLLLLVFLNFSCEKNCQEVSIHDVYTQAVIYPEHFDTWVAQHPETFDAGFNKCLDQLISLNWNIAEEQKTLCYQTHTSDIDYLTPCIQDVKLNFGNYRTLLLVIKTVARGQNAFSESELGASMILSKQLLGAFEYEQLMMPVIEAAIPFNTCEGC